MFCPHGLGISHALLDALMYLPFVAPIVLFFKIKRGEKRPGVVMVGDILKSRLMFQKNRVGKVISIGTKYSSLGETVTLRFIDGSETDYKEMFLTRPSKGEELQFNIQYYFKFGRAK